MIWIVLIERLSHLEAGLGCSYIDGARATAQCTVRWVDMEINGGVGEQSLEVKIKSVHHEFSDKTVMVNFISPKVPPWQQNE